MKIMLVVVAILLGVVIGFSVTNKEPEVVVNHVEVMKLEVPNVIPVEHARRFFFAGSDIIQINRQNHWIVSWVDPTSGEYQLVYDPENPARCVAISYRAHEQPAKIIWNHPDFDYFQIIPGLSEFEPLEEEEELEEFGA